MKKTNETESNPEYSEITPFINRPAQNFFTRWCEINDSIVPKYISRRKWEKIDFNDILEINSDGKRTLYLPKDLHLWEMVDVIKAIDSDTYANKPELANERADNLQLLGITLEKAGLYLQEYSEDLADVESEGEGKKIAQTMAFEFYNFGLSLQNKDISNVEVPKEEYLSDSDKDELDKWLLGSEVYQKRLDRLGDNPSELEKEKLRIHLFRVYFKSLAKNGYRAEGDEPWETKTGPIERFQEKSNNQIYKTFEAPERELHTSIFRRGVEKLVSQMKIVGWKEAVQESLKEGANIDLAQEKVKLINKLEITKLKADLQEIRKTGDVEKISEKEIEIAKIIHDEVNKYPYKIVNGEEQPSKILESQYVNCVGSSILGGGLLDEVGIKYYNVCAPGHSITLLSTSDKKLYWQDFTPPDGDKKDYTEITPDLIKENIDLSKIYDGVPDEGLVIHFKDWTINDGKTLTIFSPEIGLQAEIMNNTGVYLMEIGNYHEAYEAYKHATNNNLKVPFAYSGLGSALLAIGAYEDAFKAYIKALEIVPDYYTALNGIGNILNHQGRYDDAIKTHERAINIEPDNYSAYYNLAGDYSSSGRYGEAVEMYRETINVNPDFYLADFYLANALKMSGRKEEAIKSYLSFINLEKNDKVLVRYAKSQIRKLRPFYKRFSRKNK